MLDKRKYELTDQEWNLENINAKVKELESDVKELDSTFDLKPGLIDVARYNNFLMEVYHILQSLWLNRESSSRFPEWFWDLYIPENFKDMFEDIFGDFDMSRE